MRSKVLRGGAIFACGVICGALLISRESPLQSAVQAQQPGAAAAVSLDQVAADVTVLKDKATDQAHVMADVGYHYSQLWFAGRAENWPLAQFYWNETRSHLRWAVRVIPIRKDNAGNEVNLPKILEAFENTPLKELQDAITAQDPQKFEASYRFTMETCYSCHKAADKPYLRPQIPEEPGGSIMNFDPQATWPM